MAEAAMETPPQNTASRHRSEFVRGVHRFDIVGYSVRQDLGVSNSVQSGAFHAGGHTWALVCHFDRRKLESLSLELLSASITRDVVTMAGLRIDDPTGTGRWPAAVWRSREAHTFHVHASSWCSSSNYRTWKLSLPDAFKDERYVHDDRLVIQCTVDVLEDSTTVTPPETMNRFISAPPPPSISHDLHRLLLEPDRWAPDVTFVVEGTEIHAHKLVLSMRSPVFKAEFHGSMKERFTRSVRIEDMTASTFRAMLRFIYTDEMPIRPKGVASQEECRNKHVARRRVAMARDLLVAADRYGVERLRLMCENVLWESLDAATVMETLTLVDGRYSFRQLEASCIALMASNPETFAKVVASPEYQELKRSSPSFIADIMERVALGKLGNCPSCSSSSTTSSGRPKKSSSTYTSLARGTHEFTVPNMSTVLSTLHLGQDLISGSFQVGAYHWRFHLFKNGEHLSMCLLLLTDLGTDTIQVISAFYVRDPDENSSETILSASKVVYSKDNMECSAPDFITLASAKTQYVGRDGSFTICCNINITNRESCGISSTAVGGGGGGSIPVPPSNIAWHLEQLLASEQGSDVKFMLEGTTVIHAHMLVLAARSPVLYDQAAASVAGGVDGDHVRIDDMTAAVFEAVLHFIYTDQLPSSGARGEDMAMAGEVLEAAGRYSLHRLRAMCQNILAESICTQNALGILKLAERLRCQELKDYCLDYIVSSQDITTEVMKSLGSFVN